MILPFNYDSDDYKECYNIFYKRYSDAIIKKNL
jgi:hypothetical protein